MLAFSASLLILLFGSAHSRWLLKNSDGEAVVEVHYQSSGRRYYIDSGTLIWTDLALWEPNDHDNFLQLGHRAQSKHDEQLDDPIAMVRQIAEGSPYLTRPLDFTQVWRDEGGLGELNVAFWRPVCAPGFRSVGDIGSACDEWFCGWPKPVSYVNRLVCVRDELTEPCGYENEALWTNFGGLERQLGSLWSIRPFVGLRGFWGGNLGHQEVPNNGRAYCVKQPEWEEPTTTSSSTERPTTIRSTSRPEPRTDPKPDTSAEPNTTTTFSDES